MARVLQPSPCRLRLLSGSGLPRPRLARASQYRAERPGVQTTRRRSAKDKTALVKKASPLTYITKGCPPFFIVHGDKDTTEPYSQGERLLTAWILGAKG